MQQTWQRKRKYINTIRILKNESEELNMGLFGKKDGEPRATLIMDEIHTWPNSYIKVRTESNLTEAFNVIEENMKNYNNVSELDYIAGYTTAKLQQLKKDGSIIQNDLDNAINILNTKYELLRNKQLTKEKELEEIAKAFGIPPVILKQVKIQKGGQCNAICN